MAKGKKASEANPQQEAEKVVDYGAFSGTAFVPKVKRHVTIPVLPWQNGKSIVFKSEGKIFQGQELKNVRAGQAKMAPAMLMDISSTDGEIRRLVCNDVFKNELEQAFPKDSYVGKWFHCTKHAPKEGKRYSTFGINEIEAPTKG